MSGRVKRPWVWFFSSPFSLCSSARKRGFPVARCGNSRGELERGGARVITRFASLSKLLRPEFFFRRRAGIPVRHDHAPRRAAIDASLPAPLSPHGAQARARYVGEAHGHRYAAPLGVKQGQIFLLGRRTQDSGRRGFLYMIIYITLIFVFPALCALGNASVTGPPAQQKQNTSSVHKSQQRACLWNTKAKQFFDFIYL